MGAENHPDSRPRRTPRPGEASETVEPERYPSTSKDDSVQAPPQGRSFEEEAGKVVDEGGDPPGR
ncbi:hypothetical protein [Phenylobacterium sp.]|uniref:hypothetical protein n=1 Tax=Phenylobacterium sp. TaxID=1871053 RepID=UPI0025CBF951|nr:hypothetical protein [Phenylobacterium sp.]MBX3485971.1 hypothetical protein [Phenylobacterium sp.]MCW5758521.1 hypothetical protein [Phenylobacterium sp.]